MTAKKRSWLETSQTPAVGFTVGAFWIVIASSNWIKLATDDSNRVWNVIAGVGATLVAILYLGPAIVQLRRKRRDTD